MTDSNTSRRLPAASGWYWFRDAATAVGRKPLNLLAVTMLYLLIMGFLSAIPYAGIVFAALFMPFGTAFIGRSTRTALQGGVFPNSRLSLPIPSCVKTLCASALFTASFSSPSTRSTA